MIQVRNVHRRHEKLAPLVRVLRIQPIGEGGNVAAVPRHLETDVDDTPHLLQGKVSAVPRLFGRLEAGVSVIASPAVTQLTRKRLPKGKPLQAKLHAFCRQNVPEGTPA